MLSHLVSLFQINPNAKLPMAQAWRVRLCHQAAAVLMLATLVVAGVGYAWIGSSLFLALGTLLLIVQWGVVQLNREGFHRLARLGFCVCNGLLLYICSSLLGERSGFFLFYLVGLVTCLTLFSSQEKLYRWGTLAWLLLLMTLDVLLEVRLLTYWNASVAQQEAVRWLVVPGAVAMCGMLWVMQSREAEWLQQEKERQRLKLEAMIASSDETVLELDEQWRLVNLWSREKDESLFAPHLRRSLSVKDWLPPELAREFDEVAKQVLATGLEQRFEYRSPFSGDWYQARLIALPVNETGDHHLLVQLHNIQSQRERGARWSLLEDWVRHHPEAILFLDGAGYIQSCNPAAESLYGYTEAELKGQSSFMFRGEDSLNLQDVERQIVERRGWCGESRQRRRDGSQFDVWMSLTAVLNEQGKRQGLVMMSRDISEAKRQEQQLRWSERRFKSMIEHVPGMVYEWYTNEDGSQAGFSYISPRIREIFGVEPEPVMQDMTLLSSAIHPEDREAFVQSIQTAVRTRTPWNHQARLLLNNDPENTLWLMGASAPVDWNDEQVVFHGVLMDITPERRYREELMAAKERAEAASRAKAEFLSIMSHEIRTPMNAIIGLTHLLLEENPRPEQVENLSTLRFSAENLLSLINDILDYNKIEAGKIQLEQIEFDLHDLLRGVSRSAQYSGQEKGLLISELLDPDVPRWVIGDPTRLAQILSNLLSNAVKFTHRGRVELSVRRLDQGDPERALLEFQVTDSGIGIPESHLGRIFDYFTQADESITRSYGGTGLGLAITKALVERFGSEIRVHSQLGVGSSFSFQLYLPYRRQPLESGPQLPLLEPVNLSGCRILLVEDNPVNVMVAEKLLRRWGAQVDTASNGFEALEQVQRHPYDLILMDIQMPLKDGYAAAREIRALHGDRYHSLPIIALSAATTDDVLMETVRAGMDGFLAKPINPNELKRKIFRYVRLHSHYGS